MSESIKEREESIKEREEREKKLMIVTREEFNLVTVIIPLLAFVVWAIYIEISDKDRPYGKGMKVGSFVSCILLGLITTLSVVEIDLGNISRANVSMNPEGNKFYVCTSATKDGDLTYLDSNNQLKEEKYKMDMKNVIIGGTVDSLGIQVPINYSTQTLLFTINDTVVEDVLYLTPTTAMDIGLPDKLTNNEYGVDNKSRDFKI